MRKRSIIISLLMLTLLLLGACKPVPAPPPPPEQLPQNELSFRLSSNATAGDTDKYDSYQFTIYPEEKQEIYVTFQAVGGKVLVSIFTPAEETWGYNAGATESGELGELVKGRTIATTEGSFRFTASQWGNYLVTVKSAVPKGDIDVTMEYHIQ